jgi:hypothetical protein
MKFLRDWGLGIVVILTWVFGITYALSGVGKASSRNSAPAAAPAVHAMDR